MQAHLVRFTYLAAIAVAMVGWVWLLASVIEWLL
jgi:hypothetical protein